MSEQEASRFISDLQTVDGMVAEFSKVKGDQKAALALMKSKGYDATPDEVRDALLEYAATALTEEQIAEVAAGLSTGAKAGIAVGAVAGAGAVGAATAAFVVSTAMVVIGAASAII